jgi:tetratricopeptide (TPR) repeat protein
MSLKIFMRGRSGGIRRRWKGKTILFVSLAALIGAAGCRHDPQARKQHFMERGDGYFKDARYGEAVIEYKNAVREDPSFGDGYYRLGLALLRQGQWTQATQSLSRALLFTPDNLDARLRLGDMLVASGQFEDATTQANEVLKRDPENASVHLLLGQIQLQQKKYKEAEEEFRQASKREPLESVPHGNMALAELLSGDSEGAEKSFEKAAELSPNDPQYTINWANFYRSRHQPDRAEQVLRRSMEQNPKAIELPLAVADLYVYQSRNVDAKRLLGEIEGNTRTYPDAARKVADFYMQHNDAASALDRYLALAKKNTADEALIESVVECNLQLGKWVDAETWIDKHNKKDLDPAFQLLRARAETGEYHMRDAVSELQTLIQADPGNILALYYLSQADLQRGDVEGAKSALAESLRMQPGYLSALLALGNLSLQMGDSAGALRYADQIISHSYWIVDAHLIAGNAYVLRGNAAAALNEFQIAANLNPSSPTALERIGRVLTAQGKYGESEKAYESALSFDPGYSLALGGLVENFVAQNQPERARSRIEEQVRREPTLYQLQLIKGQFCMSRGDWACGEASYKKALELNAYDPTALLALAHIYASTNRTTEIAPEYELAREKFPEYLPTYVELGQVYESQGEFDRAKKAYQDALQINQNYVVALNALAWLECEHGGSLNEALELAQQAKKQQPDNPHINDTLAWIYYKQGLYPSAVQLLEPTVAANPKNPAYQFHLGMAYLTEGRQEQGRRTLQAALRAGLGSDEAKAAKEALQKSGS